MLNFIRRLAVFCRWPLITQAQVRLVEASAQGSGPGHPALETYKEAKERFTEDFTRAYIQRLLEETTGNISLAARISGLDRVSIQKIVRRLEIVAEEFRRKQD